MNCERIRELWDGYRDGSLTGPEARGLEQHLADCPQCEKLWRRESAWLAILGEKTPIVDDRAGAFTMAVVKRWARADQPAVLARIVRIAAAAAVVVLMLSVAAIVVNRQQDGRVVVTRPEPAPVDSVGTLMASINGPVTAVRQVFTGTSSWLDRPYVDPVVSLLDAAVPPEPQSDVQMN